MSRSRKAQCSGGRGCWVCGNAGESRRNKEHSDDVADRFDVSDAVSDRRHYRFWMDEEVD